MAAENERPAASQGWLAADRGAWTSRRRWRTRWQWLNGSPACRASGDGRRAIAREFFDQVSPHLPPERPVGPKGGRPPILHRTALRVLWFVLATGNRQEDMSKEMGCSGRTANRRPRAEEELASWDRLHADLLGC